MSKTKKILMQEIFDGPEKVEFATKVDLEEEITFLVGFLEEHSVIKSRKVIVKRILDDGFGTYTFLDYKNFVGSYNPEIKKGWIQFLD